MPTYSDDVLPSTSGLNLGSALARYNLYAQNIDLAGTLLNSVYASNQAGANAGVKIAAAIALLPATGGVVFADFHGSQAITTAITIPNSVTVVFFNGATYAFSSVGQFTLNSCSGLVGQAPGQGNEGVLFITSTGNLNPVLLASGAHDAAVTGIGFDGSARTSQLGPCIDFSGSNVRCFVRDCVMYNWAGYGVILRSSRECSLERISTTAVGEASSTAAAIVLTGSAAANQLTDINIRAPHYGGIHEDSTGGGNTVTSLHVDTGTSSPSGTVCVRISQATSRFKMVNFDLRADPAGSGEGINISAALTDSTFANGAVWRPEAPAGTGIRVNSTTATRNLFSNIAVRGFASGVTDISAANSNTYDITASNNTSDFTLTSNQAVSRATGLRRLGAYAFANLPAGAGIGDITRLTNRDQSLWMKTGFGNWFSISGVYNVKAFGAFGDGVTDDQAPIQSAINAATIDGGGIVYFPSGTYIINSATLFIDGTKVTLKGVGWGSTLQYNTLDSAIEIRSGSSKIVIEDLRITSSAAASGGTLDKGAIHFNNSTGNITFVTISRVFIDTVGTSGIRVRGASVLIADCQISGCGEHGITVSDAGTSTGSILISRCIIANIAIGSPISNTAGIKLAAALGYVQVQNCLIGTFKDFGIYVIAVGSVGTTLLANDIEPGAINTRGIYITSTAPAVHVLGGSISGGVAGFAGAEAVRIEAPSSNVTGLIIRGAWLTTPVVIATGASFAVFKSIDIFNTSTGITAIALNNGATCTIGDSTINSQGAGIDLGSSTSARLINNQISSSTSTNRYLVGTATSYFITEESATKLTVASAATITLTDPYSYFSISGTTTITSITASWTGRVVTLRFEGALTFTDGSNLILAGNFVTTADDTITLRADGANWVEVARSVN